MLRSCRHYLRAQSQGHHTIDRLEERGVTERGSTRRSSPKGRERTPINETDIATVSEAALGKCLRDDVDHIWAFQSAYILILPGNELNWIQTHKKEKKKKKKWYLLGQNTTCDTTCLCFVLINSVLFNLSCVWILF